MNGHQTFRSTLLYLWIGMFQINRLNNMFDESLRGGGGWCFCLRFIFLEYRKNNIYIDKKQWFVFVCLTTPDCKVILGGSQGKRLSWGLYSVHFATHSFRLTTAQPALARNREDLCTSTKIRPYEVSVTLNLQRHWTYIIKCPQGVPIGCQRNVSIGHSNDLRSLNLNVRFGHSWDER